MLLLVGASASGKTEIAKRLKEKYGIVKAITHTTREPRQGEANAVDYFFVNQDAFLRLKEKNSFVETTVYNGNYYGCSKGQISDNKCVVVDPNGLKSFLALGDPTVVTFLLVAPAKTRRERMANRGDAPSSIEKRIASDKVLFAKSNLAATDFTITTEGRSIDEISEDIFQKYESALKERR